MSTQSKSADHLDRLPLIESAAEYKEILKIAFFNIAGREFSSDGKSAQMGAPINVVSDPGLGKTSINKQFARSLYQKDPKTGERVGVELLLTEPGALGDAGTGVVPVPVPHPETGDTVLAFPPHYDAVRLGLHGRAGILKVDEFTTVRGGAKDALLTLIQQGKWGMYYMSPRVRRFAACNPSDIVDGDAVTAAQANRFCWFLFRGVTPEERANFLANMGEVEDEPIDVDAVEEKILETRGAYYSQAAAEVSGFLHGQPKFANRKPAPNDPASSGPWPSDRSNNMATQLMATARFFGASEDLQDKLVCGCVGSEAQIAMAVWRREHDLPNIYNWLDGKEPFEHRAARLDRTVAVIQGARTALVAENDKKRLTKWAQTLWDFASDVKDTAPDALFPLIRTMDKKNLRQTAGKDVMIKIGKLFAALESH